MIDMKKKYFKPVIDVESLVSDSILQGSIISGGANSGKGVTEAKGTIWEDFGDESDEQQW